MKGLAQNFPDRMLRVDAAKKRQLLNLGLWEFLDVSFKERVVWRVIASSLKKQGRAGFVTERIDDSIRIWRVW